MGNLEDYFLVIPPAGNNPLTLLPKDIFLKADKDIKKFVISNAMSNFDVKIARVNSGSNRELWGKSKGNETILLESLDLNNLDLQKFKDNRSQLLIRNNWFLYYGGNTMFNPDMFTLGLNFRVGSFLVKNRWDLAFSWSVNAMSQENAEDVYGGLNLGLNTRYYQPLKKLPISPYVGAGIAYNVPFSDIDATSEFIGMLGCTWALGPGSLDFGVQYGTTSKFMLTVGYTFFPWSQK
jgi:hypothetical protein